jgi:hypothetical protein
MTEMQTGRSFNGIQSHEGYSQTVGRETGARRSEAERRSLLHAALDRQLGAHPNDEVATDGEAETHPLLNTRRSECTIHLDERIEDGLQLMT